MAMPRAQGSISPSEICCQLDPRLYWVCWPGCVGYAEMLKYGLGIPLVLRLMFVFQFHFISYHFISRHCQYFLVRTGRYNFSQSCALHGCYSPLWPQSAAFMPSRRPDLAPAGISSSLNSQGYRDPTWLRWSMRSFPFVTPSRRQTIHVLSIWDCVLPMTRTQIS